MTTSPQYNFHVGRLTDQSTFWKFLASHRNLALEQRFHLQSWRQCKNKTHIQSENINDIRSENDEETMDGAEDEDDPIRNFITRNL